MRNERKFQRAISTWDEESGSFWILDTREKKLLASVLQQAFVDLYSYVKHGIIIDYKVKGRLKCKSRASKTLEEVDDLLEFMHSDTKEPWGMYWILDHISTNTDAALTICHGARDEILARKFSCADFRRKVLQMAGLNSFELI